MNKRVRMCNRAILLIARKHYRYHYDMERRVGIWRKVLFEDSYRLLKYGG